MHGTTMMFLFAVPVMQAMGIYLVPLMVGTRNVAFPRLNAFGYWIYLFGGIFLYVDVLPQHRARHRLVRYVPLAGPGVLARQARRRLGADDHLHRDRRRWSRRSSSSSRCSSSARPACRSTACRSSSGRMLVDVVHDHLRDAGGDAREHSCLIARTAWSAPTSSTRPRAATRCSGSTCSGSSATPRSTSSSCRRSASSRRSSPTFTRRPVFGYPAMVLSLIATGVPRLRPLGAPHVRDRPAAARRRASSPPRA